MTTWLDHPTSYYDDDDPPPWTDAEISAALEAHHPTPRIQLHTAPQWEPDLGDDDTSSAEDTDDGDDQAATGLNVRWLPNVFERPPHQPPELVQGLLRAGEMCAIAAPRAIGKSWFAMNLAVLLARGEGLLAGRLRVTQPARVLYAHGELDPYEAYARWYRMTSHAGPPANLAETFDPWRIRTIERRTTFRGDDGASYGDSYTDAILDHRLEQAIADHGIDVLILDPWAVYFGGKENSNEETEAALAKLRHLSLTYGTAIVIVHHISAKTIQGRHAEPEDLWRGATRLADWASTRVTILRHYSDADAAKQNMTRQDARRFADIKFLRRGEPTADFSMKMDYRTGWWDGWEAPGREVEAEKYSSETLAQMCAAAGGWPSARHAAAELDVSPSKARQLLLRAVMDGHLEEIPGPRNSRAYQPADPDEE